ncbi:hypothetical protein ZIOFF_005467 [Zingiber officinale]|uniref:Uncharacterized protein n=2 Tax=Zingiber officinale TaxID=94328 RepID=A0A8J5I1H2_ZINOF|nr:hypothetical protein ZIOFF_005467 [Zingiber officinale]
MPAMCNGLLFANELGILVPCILSLRGKLGHPSCKSENHIFLSFMGSRIITPEDVLESLMNDGTIDAIRLKIINQLKANEELKNNTITMVEQSKVLNTPGAEKQTKRELFDALRRELETQVLEKASRAVWELILDESGLGKEISETVERVFCKLSGRELLPPPQPTGSFAQESNKVQETQEKEAEKVKDIEMSESSAKKRTFGEMNAKGTVVTNGATDHPAASHDVAPLT